MPFFFAERLCFSDKSAKLLAAVLPLMRTRFSVIIPAYNEEQFLLRLLDSIDRDRSHYDEGEVEVIVADNSSTDRTAEVALSKGALVVTVGRRCIAAAKDLTRLAGAEALGSTRKFDQHGDGIILQLCPRRSLPSSAQASVSAPARTKCPASPTIGINPTDDRK
jgi:cellulose synthase/poly-beta-1,6-N-acetylglucosamine synthase-like glycosyltransferase